MPFNSSQSRLRAVPDRLFSANSNLKKITWHDDVCDGSRIFGENLLDACSGLEHFSYTVKSKEGTALCRKTTFPRGLFKKQTRALKTLRISRTSNDWESLGASTFFKLFNFQ